MGIEIDSVTMEARLPPDKIHKAIEMLTACQAKSKITLKELQSLIGFLNFACAVVAPGRAFLRRLIQLTKCVRKSWHRIRINKDAKMDIAMWLDFLHKYNGISLILEDRWLSSPTISLFTDAATTRGYAGVLGTKWFYGGWPPSCQYLNIAVMELYPIVAAIKLWGHKFSNSCLLLHCDNKAVVDIINNTSSKDPTLMILVIDNLC